MKITSSNAQRLSLNLILEVFTSGLLLLISRESSEHICYHGEIESFVWPMRLTDKRGKCNDLPGEM